MFGPYLRNMEVKKKDLAKKKASALPAAKYNHMGQLVSTGEEVKNAIKKNILNGWEEDMFILKSPSYRKRKPLIWS